VKTYLLTLPERVLRSALGLGAGAAREVSEVVLPDAVRTSQLYKNLVDATLRFVIERVGGVEGVYSNEDVLPEDFLARRTAGNAIEIAGIVAFSASPVWILAALADVCGAGRQLIPEIAEALKAQGLLDEDTEFASVDQMLDGLERTSARLAATINTPPLDVAGLRREWESVRTEARALQIGGLPSRDTLLAMWTDLKTESARQHRSIFETSSVVAMSTVRAFPDRARWFYESAYVGASRTGGIVAAKLLDHYRETLAELRETGYAAFAARQFRPYLRAAADQFSPKRQTLTERLLDKLRSRSTMHNTVLGLAAVLVAAQMNVLAWDPLTVEFIFESAPFQSAHASTIAETRSGLVAAWFGGTREGANDVGIWLSRRIGDKWTPPVEVATGALPDGTRVPTWNPVLFEARSGELSLFYKAGPSPREWWGMVRTSTNAGLTWGEARRLPDGILGPVKNKPVRLMDGTIIASSSTESVATPSRWRIHFERSRDAGATWTISRPPESPTPIDAIQPSILTHADGRLQAVGRTRSGRVFETWSSDRGETWTPLALTELPNPSAGTDAITLKDGRHLLVYNHTVKGRTPLNVAISRDGRTWQMAHTLESEPGEYSYPAVIQTSDGLVHITYTWRRLRIKHIVLDPSALKN
jgi:predicted neuraminidase